MATIRFLYKPLNLTTGTPAPAAPAPDTRPPPTELKPVKVDRWWRESSYDLWQGLEVREDAQDTMPAQWLDEVEVRGKR